MGIIDSDANYGLLKERVFEESMYYISLKVCTKTIKTSYN